MPTQVALTQRAYTLRLRGADPQDHSWRDALWRTHEAVNKGAKAFGDWLLTLRGGLDHQLANAQAPQGDDTPGREATAEEIRGRRILLALSWLSVESLRGAPEEFIVARGDEHPAARTRKVLAAFRQILQERGLQQDEADSWVRDCTDSLSAAIRDDAAWVNRSRAFDHAASAVGPSLSRAETWDMLAPFFAGRDAYLAPGAAENEEAAQGEPEDKAKDLVQKAGQWLSSRMGTGKGADFGRMAAEYQKIKRWAAEARPGISGHQAIQQLLGPETQNTDEGSRGLEQLLARIAGPGYKSTTRNILKRLAPKAALTAEDLTALRKAAEADERKCRSKTGHKGPRAYADTILTDVERACGFTYRTDRDGNGVCTPLSSRFPPDYKWGAARHVEFAVMLDHAARRVSLVHSWIKRAEASRRQFEEDAKKAAKVPDRVARWLDEYCERRSPTTGAIEPYRIRRRAVDGWREVVAAWSSPACSTADARIAAARALQDDLDKFGDIQLFEALADEEALCVWHADGDPQKPPDPEPLINYVFARDAEFKKRRFKVPAYRHPDALLHPVFCDFGKSRWAIRFAIHEARNKVERREAELKAAKAQAKVEKAQAKLAQAQAALANLPDLRALSMKLLTECGIIKEVHGLRWESKRLAHDLALEQQVVGQVTPAVSRADRLGRAVADASEGAPVAIAGLFAQKDWNGRLQAPRDQLNALSARVEKHGWDPKAIRMRDRLRWLVTFSPRLQPAGPWVQYAATFPDKAPAKPFVSRQGDYAVKHEGNDARQGHAKLILSRLPGLRVLSVDLGHRYAAACAVWETLSTPEVQAACQAAGQPSPPEDALYLHLRKGKGATIYRRIGAETLPNGELHPAPWARLDRQFLIRLQGEDREARKASPAERQAVEALEQSVGCKPPPSRPTQVHELMSEAVRSAGLALERHGRRARIAFNLTATRKLLPGGRDEALTIQTRVPLLADTLADWYALFTGRGWTDPWAEEQWKKHVEPLLPAAGLPRAPSETEATPKGMKKYRGDLTQALKPAAEALVRNHSLSAELHTLWATRWQADDALWRKRLRWLTDWILPRGVKAKASGAIRGVGGLCLTRIATIRSLYQLHKAFRMRPEPDNLRKNIPAKGEDELRDFAAGILRTMERLREQRVKQLASRIAEAALGLGRMKAPSGPKQPKRPQARVDPPCHAVVIENLTHYRPEETRTRRENRQLMSWSSSKVKKFLAEACQLHGLHLREVQANYTSRQDSRTGAPGVRCQDVSVKEFMHSPFWRKQVAQAKKKREDGKGDARERFLCDLDDHWKGLPEDQWGSAHALRIPLRGGEIFVSADPHSPAAKGIQADLNAAANIGLRALADPDWPGRWWFVPCDSSSHKPAKDKVKGSAAINLDNPLTHSGSSQGPSPHGSKPGRRKVKRSLSEIVNLWRDPSPAAVSPEHGWQDTSEYWNNVQFRVVRSLRAGASCDSGPLAR